jgi:hypothetical protein
MSRIRRALKSIVDDGNATFSGKIQSVSGATAVVITKQGAARVATQGISYQSGAEVRVQNGVIVGRVRKADTLPVYRV